MVQRSTMSLETGCNALLLRHDPAICKSMRLEFCIHALMTEGFDGRGAKSYKAQTVACHQGCIEMVGKILSPKHGYFKAMTRFHLRRACLLKISSSSVKMPCNGASSIKPARLTFRRTMHCHLSRMTSTTESDLCSCTGLDEAP